MAGRLDRDCPRWRNSHVAFSIDNEHGSRAICMSLMSFDQRLSTYSGTQTEVVIEERLGL